MEKVSGVISLSVIIRRYICLSDRPVHIIINIISPQTAISFLKITRWGACLFVIAYGKQFCIFEETFPSFDDFTSRRNPLNMICVFRMKISTRIVYECCCHPRRTKFRPGVFLMFATFFKGEILVINRTPPYQLPSLRLFWFYLKLVKIN